MFKNFQRPSFYIFRHYVTYWRPKKIRKKIWIFFSIFSSQRGYCRREYLTLSSPFAIFEPSIWRRLVSFPACFTFCITFLTTEKAQLIFVCFPNPVLFLNPVCSHGLVLQVVISSGAVVVLKSSFSISPLRFSESLFGVDVTPICGALAFFRLEVYLDPK